MITRKVRESETRVLRWGKVAMRFSASLIFVVIAAGSCWSQDNPSVLADRVTALEEKVGQLAQTQESSLRTQADAMEGVLKQLERLETTVSELLTRFNDLGRRDGDRYVPNLLSAMSVSPQLRQEVFGATSGRLEINNEMGTWMRVYVNGTRWRFPPGVSSIRIPFGPVEAQLVIGGSRIDFGQQDWGFENGRHVLRMRITNNIPQPD
jgi:hypothetical protein